MVASILKIGISQNVNRDNLVGFPISGHICKLRMRHEILMIAEYH